MQGKAIAGGLMLVWPFDLIVAAEDAQFSNPVIVFGANSPYSDIGASWPSGLALGGVWTKQSPVASSAWRYWKGRVSRSKCNDLVVGGKTPMRVN